MTEEIFIEFKSMKDTIKRITDQLKNPYLQSAFLFFFIFSLIMGAYLFAYFHPLSWDNVKQLHLKLKNFNTLHPIATPLIFISVYILYALLSLPGIFILSLLAGFLFVQPLSTLYVTIAATIGASLLFVIARTAFGKIFYRQFSHSLNRLKDGFRENSVSYLLFLRLIPLFPFWIVNLAGAFFGVSFWAFAWTTFVGMIPSVFIYTQAGKSLTLLLESHDPLNPINLFNPHLMVTLIGLALLTLLPVFFRQSKVKG